MTTLVDTLAEAIAECQSRVDADLRGLRKPGMEPQGKTHGSWAGS